MQEIEYIDENQLLWEFRENQNFLKSFDDKKSIQKGYRDLKAFISFMENGNDQYPLLLMTYMYATKHLFDEEKDKLVDRDKWILNFKIINAATSILHRHNVFNINKERVLPDQTEALLSVAHALQFIAEFSVIFKEYPGHQLTFYPEMLQLVLNAIPKSMIASEPDFQAAFDRVQIIVNACKIGSLPIRFYEFFNKEEYDVPTNVIDGYDLMLMAQFIEEKAKTFINPDKPLKMVFVFHHSESQYKIHNVVSTIVMLATGLNEQCTKKISRVSAKKPATPRKKSLRKSSIKKSPKKASHRKAPKKTPPRRK